MRGRAATVLAVAAVAVVVAVAALDALRGEPEDPAVRALRELGAEGVLVHTDEDCRPRALSLPELRPAEIPAGPGRACELSVSRGGDALAGGAARWDPTGSVYAVCRGARTQVVDPARGRPHRVETGCAPAWRPDGSLTLARGGSIVDADGGRVLLSAAQLGRAVRRPLGPVAVRDAVWPAPEVIAVLLDVTLPGRLPQGGPLQVVALFDRGQRLGAFRSLRPLERLDASPGGWYLAVQPDTVVRADGTVLALPEWLTDVRRLAWSPDAGLLAVATRANVVFLDVAELEQERSPRIVRVPLRVEDLAWR